MASRRLTAQELFDTCRKRDQRLSGWLGSLDSFDREQLVNLLDNVTGYPVVVFERHWAQQYVMYLVADEGSDSEVLFYATTRMLGWEYETHYGGNVKFLSESVQEAAAEDPQSLFTPGQYFSPSDPATATPTTRRRQYSLPRQDPRTAWPDLRRAPSSFIDRISAYCASCGEVEHHDRWRMVLGMNVGVRLPLGRDSTKGKIGKRTEVMICARCQLLAPVDSG